jgi:hypothetical protein
MDLHCPNCNGSDLKSVSLAYEEGLSRVATRTRLRGMMFGDDSNIDVGTAVTNGMSETELAKTLRPPRKWSYGWAVVVALASLLMFVRFVMTNASMVSSLEVVIFGAIGLGTFVGLSFLIWRHNHVVYPRLQHQWNQSFVCLRCATVSKHEL